MEYVLKVPKKNFELLMNGDLTFVIYKIDNFYCVGDHLLPLSDWHAALRNWKDFNSNTARTQEQAEFNNQLELLLPILLKKIAVLAKQKEKIVFHDPHIGTVLQFYGFNRLDYPFNAFEIKNMVKHYTTSKKLGTGLPQMRSPNPYGKGTLLVPTIEEFATLLQKKKSENNTLSE